MNRVLNAFLIVCSCVIILDFIIPGRTIIEPIEAVTSERQQYYNAARNAHYSYKVVTAKHAFSVSETFAKTMKIGDEIKYSISRIFNEVNQYSSSNLDKNIHSLRIVSGLVLPVLALLIFTLSLFGKMKYDILLFVFQVLLVADLIFLIVW